jgi:uncharacterized membrane protein YozB (DUF420 family)
VREIPDAAHITTQQSEGNPVLSSEPTGISAIPARVSDPARNLWGGLQRHFFVAMASFVVLVCFVGFAPSFYLKSYLNPDRDLSILLHVKGLVFSAWIILFLVQTVLIVRGSRALHQRLGWFAAVIATAMVVLVAAATVEEMRRVPPFPPPAVALALNTFDTVVFAVLVSTAVYFRKKSEWHKRLMLSATLILVGAPILRILLILKDEMSGGLLILDVLLVDLIFLLCFAADLGSRHKVHPAYLIALGMLIADQITTFSVMSWPPWINFADAIRRLVN